MIASWALLTIGRTGVRAGNSIPWLSPPITAVQTLTPNAAASTRCQRLCPGWFSFVLKSGRNWPHFVHLSYTVCIVVPVEGWPFMGLPWDPLLSELQLAGSVLDQVVCISIPSPCCLHVEVSLTSKLVPMLCGVHVTNGSMLTCSLECFDWPRWIEKWYILLSKSNPLDMLGK